MDDEGLIVARRDGDPGDLPKLNRSLLLQLVALIQAVEVEVAQSVDAGVWLQAAVEFGHMGRVQLLRILIHISEHPHLRE